MQPWTQNCGVRRLPLDFRDQYFGCEIELTGINRATAAQTLADLFGTCAEHSGGGYDAYRVKDLDGKEWKIVRDGSIHPECRRRSVLIGETYKVELNSPKLEYGEMEKLQEVVRALRRAGGIVNDSCGMHVHVDASKHTPQSLKNVLSIMYSKEDILFAALKVNPARIDSYCQAVDEPILEEIRKLPSGASMDQLKDRWYQGRDGSDYHYHSSRYRACNMHSVFYHGTIEWRLFNSTLHAGEAKANIILAMAISAQGINQKYTQFRKTPIGDNPAFTFRTFLLRLGLIGPEYKNVRMHDFARAAKAHGLLFCPIRDKMDPDHIEIAILQDDASKANRIIDKLQLAIVDTGTAELIDTVQQERGEPAPETERVQTEDGAVDFEIGADEEQFNMGFPQGSENASPSEPFSDSSKSFANSLSPRADQLRAKGERPSVRMELSDITAYLRRKVEPPKDRMPKMPVKIKRKEKTL